MYKEQVKVANIFKSYSNPIAQIVQNACMYESELHAKTENRRANLKSIMGIMAFDWSEGMDVEIEAEGTDAQEAVEAIRKFLLCQS